MIEPFDGYGDFTLLQQPVKVSLTREGTIKDLKVQTCRIEKMTDDEWVALTQKDKPEKMTTEEGEVLKDMATSKIFLCLLNNTLQNVRDLTNPIDIWDKLECCCK